ncbi:AraC family transcriptional regulator [Paenibacillus qinlingensis]|uniref:AraC-like DNA-binding protein/mannose-6-phosphate isomerase-like protein (Cupin superfamily) n=1 Tax=Paenibacillus qinlingensis TaxID=1837343 RepID=A0ABU1NTS9_9BACL|nr:AraC family transcriptional regulator [Paenibacillus qinlingensis]MDR6550744.1 AraC-like DNA-binding protein/mannose-6-phosphate isomerase-like protein (cupin superfamily) [Paenibacillus qinlingensis]
MSTAHESPQVAMRYTDLDIKIPLGPMLINLIYINYEAPIASWGYPNHCHSSYELHYITRGKGTLEVAEKTFLIKPGTFYLTGPGVYHRQLADSEDPMDEFCINFEVRLRKRKPQKNDTYLTQETKDIWNTLLNTSFWFGQDELGTVNLFGSIMDEFEQQWLGQYTVIQSLATQIIVNAVRSFAGERRSTYHIPKKLLNDSRRFLADDYFRLPHKDMSSKELAAQIGISQRQLERLMQSYYGVTFREKLQFSRMEKAKELLRNMELPINAVADQIGYMSPSYFTKHFRSYTGLTPMQFRQQYM